MCKLSGLCIIVIVTVSYRYLSFLFLIIKTSLLKWELRSMTNHQWLGACMHIITYICMYAVYGNPYCMLYMYLRISSFACMVSRVNDVIFVVNMDTRELPDMYYVCSKPKGLQTWWLKVRTYIHTYILLGKLQALS